MPWRLERRLSSIQAIGLMETVCVHCSWPPRDPRGATEYQYGLWPDTCGTRLSHVASTRRHCLHLGRRWWSRVTCHVSPVFPSHLYTTAASLASLAPCLPGSGSSTAPAASRDSSLDLRIFSLRRERSAVSWWCGAAAAT